MSSTFNTDCGLDFDTIMRVIHKIPSNIFFKDTKLRYQFMTKRWEQLNTKDAIGKTDLEIRIDKENAELAMKSDLNILNTGRGCKYVIKSDIEGGSLSYLELIKEPVFDETGKVIGIVGLINDVTDKVVFEQQLKEANQKDHLTTLYNRKTGVEIIDEMLKDSWHNRAFMLLDLNDFKHINDVYGHQMGDAVLKEFAIAMKRSIYDDDVALRLGGDEFIIFLANVKSKEQIMGFHKKFLEYVNAIKIEGFEEPLTASIGVTLVNESSTFDELYKKADEVMYTAKRSGQSILIV